MQHFYPIIHAGRRPRHRLSGIMRGGFVLVLSALMLPAAANAAAESSATATVNPQNTGGGENPAYGIGHRRGHARGSRCGRFCRNKRIVTRHADRQRGTLRTRGGGRRRLAGNIVPRHAAADRQGGSRTHFGGRSPVGGHDWSGRCRRDGLHHDETQGHHRFRQLDLGRPYRAYPGLQHHHGVDRHRRD